jgi:hypothetical protein
MKIDEELSDLSDDSAEYQPSEKERSIKVKHRDTKGKGKGKAKAKVVVLKPKHIVPKPKDVVPKPKDVVPKVDDAAGKKKRRPPQSTGVVCEPPCNCCESKNITCYTQTGGYTACLNCAKMKLRCNELAVKKEEKQRPTKRSNVPKPKPLTSTSPEPSAPKRKRSAPTRPTKSSKAEGKKRKYQDDDAISDSSEEPRPQERTRKQEKRQRADVHHAMKADRDQAKMVDRDHAEMADRHTAQRADRREENSPFFENYEVYDDSKCKKHNHIYIHLKFHFSRWQITYSAFQGDGQRNLSAQPSHRVNPSWIPSGQRHNGSHAK